MNQIHGQSRQQLEFGCLEESISRENSVRVMDAFVDKLDSSKLGFVQREKKSEGRDQPMNLHTAMRLVQINAPCAKKDA